MTKELFARVIQPTTTVVSFPEPDDIHEKIRQGVLKLLTDAGYSNLTVDVGPKNGCSHESCHAEANVDLQNVKRDQITELTETFFKCARSAFVIVVSEIIGNCEILDKNWHTTTNIKDIK